MLSQDNYSNSYYTGVKEPIGKRQIRNIGQTDSSQRRDPPG